LRELFGVLFSGKEHYMTEEARREEKKNLLLEWTETAQELDCQKAVAARMADLLSHVASKLRSEPEKLIFSGDSTPLQYMQRELIVEAAGLDVLAICGVRDAIRKLLDRQRDLRPRMAAFNLPQS
jgi:hypothetical protein